MRCSSLTKYMYIALTFAASLATPLCLDTIQMSEVYDIYQNVYVVYFGIMLTMLLCCSMYTCVTYFRQYRRYHAMVVTKILQSQYIFVHINLNAYYKIYVALLESKMLFSCMSLPGEHFSLISNTPQQSLICPSVSAMGFSCNPCNSCGKTYH